MVRNLSWSSWLERTEIADFEILRLLAMGFQEPNMCIWCFGDSNTFGYDPCAYFGGRYVNRWPELLAKETGFYVINDGENGRMIPRREQELLRFRQDAEKNKADILIIMLGGNDLLNGAAVDEITARMEMFLTFGNTPHVLLIGPPVLKRGAWVPDDQLVSDSAEMSQQYRLIAERLGIWFTDAGTWDVELTYDGVHFTEQGHIRFAKELASVLRSLLE